MKRAKSSGNVRSLWQRGQRMGFSSLRRIWGLGALFSHSTRVPEGGAPEDEKLADSSLHRFLADVARRDGAPGGGSIAALSGAGAAALLALVCRVSARHNASIPLRPCVPGDSLGELLQGAEDACRRLLALVDEDVLAYREWCDSDLSSAGATCTDSPAGGPTRAIDVPKSIARCCEEVAEMAERAAPLVRQPSLLADLRAAEALARGAAVAAAEIASANSASMKRT
jgi:formiminotetrahydrofolate cyclodeaminase